jgi:hypothetical protein
VGENFLATSLCTWSPNELAHLLSGINDHHLLISKSRGVWYVQMRVSDLSIKRGNRESGEVNILAGTHLIVLISLSVQINLAPE